MFQKRLIWQLYPSFLLITLLTLVAVTWYSTRALRTLYLDTLEEDLQSRARVIGEQIQRNQLPLIIESIDPLCKTMGRVMVCRVTVILPDGTVAGESDEDPASMENHKTKDRLEIQQALQGRNGRELRFSHTVLMDMMYIAVPLMNEQGEVTAIVRTSLPAMAINGTLKRVYFQILMGGFAVALIAAAVCLLISLRLSRPLRMLKEGADRFAAGDLQTRLPVPRAEEIGHVAEAMNKMAEQLHTRIRTITQQRKQQEAIFASMVEGVLAVDRDKKLIHINQAAAQLLGVPAHNLEGKRITEIVDDPDLCQLIDNSLSSPEPLDAEIVLSGNEKRFLHTHGTALQDSDGVQSGFVIVLHDVTTLRRLENLRQDFVANVSHELKTPITSIKGFVETLMDGAVNDPDDAMRFLEIIAKQADRLHSIIEDLLSLSRIEQEKDKESIPLEPYSIRTLLDIVADLCMPRASTKDITLERICPEDIQIMMNPPLLEQAIVNLIDNAIKYSSEGSTIRLQISRSNEWLTIGVKDWGCGIAGDHLPRIFERFYRVDKARSRKLGGTGLGLAIVKHITQAHGGYVTVDSELGTGSTFSIHLPLDTHLG